MIDSVHDDKQMALHQARMLLESPHHMAVRVLQEVYDDETDKSMSSVVFKQQKGDEKKKKTKEPAKKKSGKIGAGPTKKVKKKENGFAKTIILMVLALGGVGLGLIVIVGVLMQAFN